MKNTVSILALLSLLTCTTQAQAIDFQSVKKFEIKTIQVTAAPYNGRAPYSETFNFITSVHLDLVDPAIRRQWTNRWQPDNVVPSVFQSRQATEKAIKAMMQSLNRKHDFFMSPEDTAREKTWLTYKDSVRTSYLKNNIALIKIPSFLPQTVDQEAQTAISNCNRAPAIIIDLRGNTGGQIKEALSVAANLIQEGLIYTAKARVDDKLVETKLSLSKTQWVTVESGTSPITSYTTRTQLAVHPAVPLAVLVDSKTASAAELLTGALKQSRRAVIIGSRTYGKGTGNKLTFLPSNGRALQVTFEKLCPGGLDTDGVGIQPDVVINQPEGSPVDYQLEAAVTALSKSLPQQEPAAPAPTTPTKPTSPKQPLGGSPYVRFY